MLDNKYKVTKLATTFAACVNITLALLKFCIGFVFSSALLMADGIHSFTDVFADMTAFLAARFGQKKPDSKFQYGYHRLETFASIIIAIILIIAAYAILYAGVLHPEHLELSLYSNSVVLTTAVLSMCVNFVAYLYILKMNSAVGSDLIKSCAYHQFSDALTTLLVILSIVLDVFGFLDLTRLATVVIIFLIVKCSLELLSSAIEEILDKGVSENKRMAYKQMIEQIEGVTNVHALRTRTVANHVLLDCHVSVDELSTVSECDFVAHSVESKLKNSFDEVFDVTIHMDPDRYELNEGHAKWPARQEIMKSCAYFISPSVHDDTVFIAYSSEGVNLLILSDGSYAKESLDALVNHNEWLCGVKIFKHIESVGVEE